MTERRARGKGQLSDADLTELGVTLDEAKALGTALKATRAQQPDRDAARTRPVKDSPFAILSALTAPPAPAARPKRRRPRRARPASTGTA